MQQHERNSLQWDIMMFKQSWEKEAFEWYHLEQDVPSQSDIQEAAQVVDISVKEAAGKSGGLCLIPAFENKALVVFTI